VFLIYSPDGTDIYDARVGEFEGAALEQGLKVVK